jgi:hypothetical protein
MIIREVEEPAFECWVQGRETPGQEQQHSCRGPQIDTYTQDDFSCFRMSSAFIRLQAHAVNI